MAVSIIVEKGNEHFDIQNDQSKRKKDGLTK